MICLNKLHKNYITSKSDLIRGNIQIQQKPPKLPSEEIHITVVMVIKNHTACYETLPIIAFNCANKPVATILPVVPSIIFRTLLRHSDKIIFFGFGEPN